MRDLASLYLAWQQLERYHDRGLKPRYSGAVFDELHLDAKKCRRTQPGARMAAALLLDTVFKPRQPQFGRP